MKINPLHFGEEYGQNVSLYIDFLRSVFDIYHLVFALNIASLVRPRPGAVHGEGGRGRVQFRKAFGVTLFWWDSIPGNPADTPEEKGGKELFLRESDSRDCGELPAARPPNPGALCWRCGGGGPPPGCPGAAAAACWVPETKYPAVCPERSPTGDVLIP